MSDVGAELRRSERGCMTYDVGTQVVVTRRDGLGPEGVGVVLAQGCLYADDTYWGSVLVRWPSVTRWWAAWALAPAARGVVHLREGAT